MWQSQEALHHRLGRFLRGANSDGTKWTRHIGCVSIYSFVSNFLSFFVSTQIHAHDAKLERFPRAGNEKSFF